jgi:hypothetical protein
MAPRIKKSIVTAVMAAIGQLGGQATAASMTQAQRTARAKKAGLASRGGGWPKGKKRGPSPLKGRKVTR